MHALIYSAAELDDPGSLLDVIGISGEEFATDSDEILGRASSKKVVKEVHRFQNPVGSSRLALRELLDNAERK